MSEGGAGEGMTSFLVPVGLLVAGAERETEREGREDDVGIGMGIVGAESVGAETDGTDIDGTGIEGTDGADAGADVGMHWIPSAQEVMVLTTELKTVDGPTLGTTEVGFGIAMDDDSVPELLSLSSLPSPDPSSGVSPSPSFPGVPFEGVSVDGMLVGFASSPQSAVGATSEFPSASVKVAETVRTEKATRVSVEKRI